MNTEDTQTCVSRNIDEERKNLPEAIYLIPESDGDSWSWCDTPDPTSGHIPEEAVKYIRVKEEAE